MNQSTRRLPKRRQALTFHNALHPDYFRIRDFEYVQPLYDLAFLLEIDALAKGSEVPKYRTFALWKAGYSLDGYSTVIDRWLDGDISDAGLDYVPSARIRQYLEAVRRSGSIPELRSYRAERYMRCLRLRSIRGLGPKQIALLITSKIHEDAPNHSAAVAISLHRDDIARVDSGERNGPWQTAHVVPPLARFLNTLETILERAPKWQISGIDDALTPVRSVIKITSDVCPEMLQAATLKALRKEKLFRKMPVDSLRFSHQLGWQFTLALASPESFTGNPLANWITELDPLSSTSPIPFESDLHLHTAWSDGASSVGEIAEAVVANGLKYFAVTDHSRSSKIQGGLTPHLWLRQSSALKLATPTCPILHGIEVDILRNGDLDLPHSLLDMCDLVVASVHTSWAESSEENTARLVRAIATGRIDILAHPTSTVIGKPGVPDYYRPPADIEWDEVFTICAEWRVAVEFNCFPSRLDLAVPLLEKAASKGCAISFGSDAHARSHLFHLRIGAAVLGQLSPATVLNRLTFTEIKRWIEESRAYRNTLSYTLSSPVQAEFTFSLRNDRELITARIQDPKDIPHGSPIVGIDLTAGDKATGVALLDGSVVHTSSMITDDEILEYVARHRPKIVSIDSPLGLPGGGDQIDPGAGIVRVAEHDLASIGIPAYPALIDSMQRLTLRGIALRKSIEALPFRPQVIESYPGAAQDILCIPRKQKSLHLLREGLRRLGLRGEGLQTKSHDEMDAITSAIVGRYFESNDFEPMGIISEAQLIVPKVGPLAFDAPPVFCLAGKTGAGKSVVARYLATFYGFKWIRTRDLIRELLVEDLHLPSQKRVFSQVTDEDQISEKHLQEFGGLILEKYKQIPLRKKLAEQILECNLPVVVDSIRDVVDIKENIRDIKSVIIWFIDCDETTIRTRLLHRKKFGKQAIQSGSPVDKTAPHIRAEANRVLPNSGSLEDLRHTIDDSLFASLKLAKN